jgi:hypothetical protein
MEFTSKEDLYDAVAHLYFIVKSKLIVHNNSLRALKKAEKTKDTEEINIYQPMVNLTNRELIDIDNMITCFNVPLSISYRTRANGLYYEFTIKYKDEVIGIWKHETSFANIVWTQVKGETVINYNTLDLRPLKPVYKDNIEVNIEK